MGAASGAFTENLDGWSFIRVTDLNNEVGKLYIYILQKKGYKGMIWQRQAVDTIPLLLTYTYTFTPYTYIHIRNDLSKAQFTIMQVTPELFLLSIYV